MSTTKESYLALPKQGSVPLPPGADASDFASDTISGSGDDSQEPIPRNWKKYGGALTLLIAAGITIGKKVLLLLFILHSLSGESSHDYLMSCNPNKYGNTAAVMCEFTKGFVRGFPFLGVAVALLVLGRMLLRRRLYYVLLKRGALLDFANTFWYCDPVIWSVALSAFFAFSHFALRIWYTSKFVQDLKNEVWRQNFTDNTTDKGMGLSHISQNEHFQETKKVISSICGFYVVPVALFTLFLLETFDTETYLMPLSKFFENDVVGARKVLSRIVIIPEGLAVEVINEKILVEPQTALDCADEPDRYTTDDQYKAFINQCRGREGEVDPPSACTACMPPLIRSLWPAKVLFDKRVCDDESNDFRIVWVIYLIFSAMAAGVIVYFFVYSIGGSIRDIGNGETSDIASMTVKIIIILISSVIFAAIGHTAVSLFQTHIEEPDDPVQ